MHRNAIWIALLGSVIVVSLWFAVKAGDSLKKYLQLKSQAPAVIEKISIEEQKKGHFRIIATFSFSYGGCLYEGRGKVGNFYPNPWAAELAAKGFSQKALHAWFNPKDPNSSVLEKHFPLKTTLSAVILLGLTLYFFFLGIYVRAQNAR